MKRYLVPISAAALVGLSLPFCMGAIPASAQSAADHRAGKAGSGPGFSGYSAAAVAAPVRIEIYEPTIPIPSEPQLEVELAYTKVEADSGSSLGRASWLWPGDPVGEGAKTFGEQLGLPSQLFENGYPVQVNSGQPSGEEKQADEPFPGTVMRTGASAERTYAQAGFSPDGEVGDGTGGGGGDGGGGGGVPGLPGPPGVPGLPALPGLSGGSASSGADLLGQFGDAITGTPSGTPSGTQSGVAEDGSDPAPGGGAPGLPPQVAALVDVEGYTSSSQDVASEDRVTTVSRAALGDVTLLGGLVTLEGVTSTSTSTSDGATSRATGRSALGGITVAGQEFSFGSSGYHAGPQQGDAPAVPDQAAAALKQLGLTITLPKPDLSHGQGKAASTVSALQVEIDTKVLRSKLDALPLDTLIGALPDDPKELKSNLQAVAGLSPRIVLTLGTATTEVETVQGIDIPTDVPDNDPGGASGGAGGSGGGGGAGSAGAGPAGTPGGSAPASAGGAPAADSALPPSTLTGAGLPPLYSIPGAILAGGILLAAVGGSWLRRIGVIALGGTGSCSHGLDSGLPDLRKTS
ncbi:choice-of-anchor P family protein [Nocardioides sp.]|uniref:choice-of-anchor P family protein n=1 Tax=Nocardioides sp. TaxID=35761 RepID=UPI0037832359